MNGTQNEENVTSKRTESKIHHRTIAERGPKNNKTTNKHMSRSLLLVCRSSPTLEPATTEQHPKVEYSPGDGRRHPAGRVRAATKKLAVRSVMEPLFHWPMPWAA